VTSATTTAADTTPPTNPTNLTATVAGTSQITLAWTASTDNVGVTGYRVERCQGASCTTFGLVATPATTPYTDTGLAAGTAYSYRVRATDAANNLSGYSNVASATTQAAAAISFRQVNSAIPTGVQTTVTVAYLAAQTAGNLNVVVVGWGDNTSVVNSVTDTKGNLYTRAVGPTAVGGAVHSQSIYYAKNIVAAAGGNTVTVQFNAAVQYPDIRILEYSGLDPVNPVDVTVAATGSSATSSSGAVTTTNANDLLVAANIVQTTTTAAGAGFTSRVITSPNGDIAEDRIVTAVGSYSATATLSGAGTWVMQLVAFKTAPTGPDTTPPTAPLSLLATSAGATQINLAWTASTDTFGVTGYQVERCLGVSCTTFAQIGTPTGASFTDTGLIPSTTYSYRVRATDAVGNLSPYSNVATATTTIIDTIPPTAPSALAATVVSFLQINLTWTASTDNLGVTEYSVERCQGANCTNFVPIASLVSTQTQYADSGLPAGTYSYRVRARDLNGNWSGYSTVVVQTLGSTSGQVGQWSTVQSWPIVSVHSTLLPNGKVLQWDIALNQQLATNAQVWDPITNTFAAVPFLTVDLFCAGHTLLGDGRVLVVGGHIANNVGLTNATIFDSSTQNWADAGTMAFGRWYPTAIRLPSGKVLVVAGTIDSETNIASIPELYDPIGGSWTQLNGAANALPMYPFLFVLPNGKVLLSGTFQSAVRAQVLDVNTQTWTTVSNTVVQGGSAAMYLPGKVINSGMGTLGAADVTRTPSASTTYVLDMNQPTPQWRQTSSMAFKRDFHNLTILADGNVLVTGGGQTTGATDASTAVLTPELWSPVTERWLPMADMQTPRIYHSEALLLPDGRVLVSGGGRNNGVFAGTSSVDRFNAEIYSPPYLFNGVRPTITSAPSTIQYGTHFSVATPDGATISKVNLIGLGSVTHSFNTNQRFIPLSFSQVSGGLDIIAPVDANLAPPGYYMLFILDGNGVPSIAKILKVQ
jgi:chitodextrinase